MMCRNLAGFSACPHSACGHHDQKRVHACAHQDSLSLPPSGRCALAPKGGRRRPAGASPAPSFPGPAQKRAGTHQREAPNLPRTSEELSSLTARSRSLACSSCGRLGVRTLRRTAKLLSRGGGGAGAEKGEKNKRKSSHVLLALRGSPAGGAGDFSPTAKALADGKA